MVDLPLAVAFCSVAAFGLEQGDSLGAGGFTNDCWHNFSASNSWTYCSWFEVILEGFEVA